MTTRVKVDDNTEAYVKDTYVRKPKNTKNKSANGSYNMAVKRQVSEPATTAVSDAPFSIVSGIRAAQPWLKIFIYGDYGAGKTVLSAQSADVERMRDVLFINIESGIQSVIGSGAIENHNMIDVIECKTFDRFVLIHKMLLAYCQARDDDDTERIRKMAAKYGFDPKKRYRTVVIDSLSELNEISLARAFGENQDDLMSVSDSDDTRRDFGRNRQAMLKTVRAFRNLPMHVITTCGQQWDEDERKKLGYQPRLTGQLAKQVQAFWDVVGFLQTSSKKSEDGEDGEPVILRRLWLQRVGKFDAKNRLSSQDVTHLVDPTMKKLVSLLTKAQKAK